MVYTITQCPGSSSSQFQSSCGAQVLVLALCIRWRCVCPDKNSDLAENCSLVTQCVPILCLNLFTQPLLANTCAVLKFASVSSLRLFLFFLKKKNRLHVFVDKLECFHYTFPYAHLLKAS